MACVNADTDNALQNFQTDFVETGRRRGVSHFSSSDTQHPKWVNPELIQAGQAFVRKYLFSIFFAHFISLIFLLCYLPVRYTLLRTGRSDTVPKAIRRYLMTLIHIKAWYEGEFVNEDEHHPLGVAVQDIRKIRTLHCRIAKSLSSKPTSYSKGVPAAKADEGNACNNSNALVKALHEDLKNVTGDPVKSVDREFVIEAEAESMPIISQLDMAVTQFCFMGFISLQPASFGIRDSEDEHGLKGFVHMWAVIGHHLGIEDQFNLCLEANAHIRPLIVSQILLPNLHLCDLDTVKLWTSLTTGVASFVPGVSLHALLRYIIEVLFNTQSVGISALFNAYDSICYKIMDYCFNSWTSKLIVRSVLNALLRLAVYLTALRIFPASMAMPVTRPIQARPYPTKKRSNNNHVYTTLANASQV